MRFTFFFPILLSILLGGAGFWLNRVTDVEIVPVRLNPTEPQYILNIVKVKRFDEKGNIRDALQAERAWQLPENQQIHLSKPHIQLQENGKSLYDVSAEKGTYNLDTQKADFYDRVHIVKYAENGSQNVRMNSTFLHIDTVAKTATTERGEVLKDTRQPPNSRIKTIIYDTP